MAKDREYEELRAIPRDLHLNNGSNDWEEDSDVPRSICAIQLLNWRMKRRATDNTPPTCHKDLVCATIDINDYLGSDVRQRMKKYVHFLLNTAGPLSKEVIKMYQKCSTPHESFNSDEHAFRVWRKMVRLAHKQAIERVLAKSVSLKEKETVSVLC